MIKIKKKLEDNYKFFYWRLKLKKKTIKKIKIKLKKNHKLELNAEIKNKSRKKI
jgi:hypothetical protein